MKLYVLTLLLLVTIQNTIAGKGSRPKNDGVSTLVQWNQLEYDFPTSKDRKQAIANGNLVPTNAIPIDVAPHYGSNGQLRVFTTIPRFQTGIPYSLATVTERTTTGGGGPLLQAYPGYDWHNSHGSNCDGITSAFRVAITECNQMWVIDSGVIGSVQHCPPQLLLFDLNTDQMLHRYRFNSSHYTPTASLLITPVVSVRDPPPSGNCQNTMIYVADVVYHGLVVYDYQQNVAWRVENKFMYPDPDFGTHTLANEKFTLMDGIFGMSVSQQHLYFHPLASNTEYAVPLSILDNSANFASGVEAMPNEFRSLGIRSSECAAEAMDSHGNIYCVTFNPIKLISWNINTPYKAKNLREIPVNAKLLEFVSGMKVVKNMEGKEELWMLSNRFQRLSAGTQNFTEVNFRIMKRTLDDVQNGIEYETPNGDLHHKLVFNN